MHSLAPKWLHADTTENPTKPSSSSHRNLLNHGITSLDPKTENTATVTYESTNEPSNSTLANVSATKFWLILKPDPLLDGRPGTILAQPEENELDVAAFSPTEQHQKPIVEKVTGNFQTTESKTISRSNRFAHTSVANENPLVAKSYTTEAKKVIHTTTADELRASAQSKPKPVILIKNFPPSIENYPNDFMPPLSEFRSESRPNRVHEIEKKSTHSKGNRMSVGEFKALIEHAVRRLFFPLARYLAEGNLLIVNENPQSVRWDGGVMLKRFGFVNLPPGLRGREPRGEVLDWTLLDGNARINLTSAIDKLFYEDVEDVRWLVFLSPNTTMERIRSNFFEYLASSSVAKLSLEYHGCKINALLMVPRRLMENVSLPGNGSSIEVNEELRIEEPIAGDDIGLELSGWHYRAFQLLASKWPQRRPDGKFQNERFVDTKHDDIELYIFVFLGAICIFGVLSPLLYGVYRLIQSYSTNVTFKVLSDVLFVNSFPSVGATEKGV